MGFRLVGRVEFFYHGKQIAKITIMQILKTDSVATKELFFSPVNDPSEPASIINGTLLPIKLGGSATHNQFTSVLPFRDGITERKNSNLDFTGSCQPIVIEFDHDTLDHQKERIAIITNKIYTVSQSIFSGNKSYHLVLWFRHFANSIGEYKRKWFAFYWWLSDEFPELLYYHEKLYKDSGSEDQGNLPWENIPDVQMASANRYFRQAGGWRPDTNKEQITVPVSGSIDELADLDWFIGDIVFPEGSRFCDNTEPHINQNDPVITTLIQYPIRTLILEETGVNPPKSGRMACPKCGGEGRFEINDVDNYVKCFGADCVLAGNPIEFLIRLHGITKSDAINKLKSKMGIIDTEKRRNNKPLGVIPEPWDFYEYVKDDRPRPDDFIEGILPTESVCGIVSNPGIGKTILTMNLCIHLAAGKDWFDLKIFHSRKVLYLIAEGGYWLLRDRIKKMSHYDIKPEEGMLFLFPVRPFNLIDNSDMRLVESVINSNQPDIIVFDTLIKTHNVDENDNPAMQRILDIIRSFITGKNRSAFIIHHQSKGGLTRGATAIEAELDTVLKMSWNKKADRTRELEFSKVRHSEMLPPLSLILNLNNLIFEKVHTGNGDEKFLISLLNNGGLTKADAKNRYIEKTGRSKSSFYKAWNIIKPQLSQNGKLFSYDTR